MTKKKITKTECIQCMGDEMLEVRKDANQLHEVMGFLSHHFADKDHKEGTKVIDYVRAMANTHDRYKQAIANRRAMAERKVREANDLIVALRFVSKASKNNSSGLSVGGASLAIGIDQLLSVAIDKIQLLVASDSGLLNGHQSDSEIDPLTVLWQEQNGH